MLSENLVKTPPRSYLDPRLFSYLASLAPATGWAWDCGTGKGDAALALAEHFSAVRATDVNPALTGRAVHHERIFYSVESAERSAIASHTVDLVVAAQTLHWLGLDSFYAEVQRVLKPGGVIAAWCYGRCKISPQIDRRLKPFYRAVEPYWPPAFEAVAQEYRTLRFPFEEISAPAFWVSALWSFSDLRDYLSNWSATRRLMACEPRKPAKLLTRILEEWGVQETRRLIRWPVHLRLGRNAS